MRAIDTNVLVRLMTRDNREQTDAAETFVEGGAWVSHLVLTEAIWVLGAVYEIPDSQLALAVEMVVNHRALTIQDVETVELALESYRKRPALGFSDCLILEVARKAGHLPLGTFDKKLGKLNGAQRVV